MNETEVVPIGDKRGLLALGWRNMFRPRHRFVSGVILFGLAFFINVTGGFNMADESWFLQVVRRVTSGDVLYRDVFFGVTPLSVYITAAFATIFGTEILVVKAVVVVCFVLSVLVSCRITRQLGSTHFPLLLVTALLVYGLPIGASAYKALANLFF